MESIDWGAYRVVGFSSTFQQNTASFALARRIKEKYPDVTILLGGSNFDDEMGLEFVHAIEAIDYAVIGEGDIAFPSILLALQEGRDPLTIPGVVGKRNGRVNQAAGIRSQLRQMDELPMPDYHDFYTRRALLTLPDGEEWEEMSLPFESARGCWWGEKHHCTFCGLNALGMNFRSKSIDHMIDELTEMSRAYGKFDFSAVDNIIEPRYLKSLFSKLNEAGGMDYTFFYEVKANMSREQIKTLSIGGVKAIQPGLESLSSHVLELMNKGVKAIQNVNLLRWTVYYEVRVLWNILWGDFGGCLSG
jgi:ribosomal peptide maturation radical SAM protein 1